MTIGSFLYSLKSNMMVSTVVGLVCWPLSVLVLTIFRPPLTLAYHKIVSTNDVTGDASDICITQELIERQISILRLLGYKFTLSFSEKKRGQCILTFDDGYASTFALIKQSEVLSTVPVLHFLSKAMLEQRYFGWAQTLRNLIKESSHRWEADQSTRAVKAGSIDEVVFWRQRSELLNIPAAKRKDYLQNYFGVDEISPSKSDLSTSDVVHRYLCPDHCIACHSLEHDSVTNLDNESLRLGAMQNSGYLVNQFADKYLNVHALPYGVEPDTEEKREILHRSYEAIFLTRPYLKKSDPEYYIPRICISNSDGILLFLLKCSGITNWIRNALSL